MKKNKVYIEKESIKKHIDLKNKNNSTSKKFFLFFWITTICVFVTQFIIMSSHGNVSIDWPDWMMDLVFLNVTLGILSFLVIKKGIDKNSFFHRNIWLLIFIYLLTMVIPVLALDKDKYIRKIETNVVTPTPTLLITQTPTIKPKPKNTTNIDNTGLQINCTGPDGKTFLTTQTECTKFNQDWSNTKTINTTTKNGMVNCWQKRSDGSYVYNFGTIPKSECDAQYKALSDSLSHFRDPVKGSDIISCSYPNEYDFGKITYDQCKIKVATYYKEKSGITSNSPTIGTQNPTTAPIVSQKTKTQCQAEANAKYQAGLVQFGGGSAMEAVAITYGIEMNACNQYP